MSGPRRLLDDPDFRWETDCDLGDEAILHEGLELGALKERVLAAIEAPPVPPEPTSTASTLGASGAAVKGALGVGLAVVAALGVGYMLGAAQPLSSEGVAEPEAVIEQVVSGPDARLPVAAAPVPAVAAPEAHSTEVVEPVASPQPENQAPAAVEGGASEPVRPAAAAEVAAFVMPAQSEARGTSEAPTEESGTVVAEVAAPGGVDAVDGSRLDVEMEVYDTAVQAMASGDYAGAVPAFRSYLRQFPGGHLSTEAELSLLECLFEAGSFAEAEAQASRLLHAPGFGGRERELSLVRAESLILLDRCSEALAIVDALGERDSRTAAVRRECKRRR